MFASPVPTVAPPVTILALRSKHPITDHLTMSAMDMTWTCRQNKMTDVAK